MAVIFRSALTYHVASGDRVRTPMLLAQVGGEATRLVVDTGATVHLLTVAFADMAGLGMRYEPAEAGTDSAGASVDSWSIGDVETKLDGGETVLLADVIAIEGPPPFGPWGIGGIVSPQRLWPRHTVVFDLARDELLVTDDEFALDGYAAIAAQRQSAGTIVVVATVPPSTVSFAAMLDTGAGTTDVETAVVARNGEGDGAAATATLGYGASGEAIEGRELAGQTLQVDGHAFEVPSLCVRDEVPKPDDLAPDELPPQGLVGMDVMKGTVVVIAPTADGRVTWLVPSRDRA